MGEDRPVLTDSRLQYNRQNVAALYRIQKALMTNNLDFFKGFIVFGCAALHYTFRQRLCWVSRRFSMGRMDYFIHK